MNKEYSAGLSNEQDEIGDIDVPMHVAGSGKLDCLVEAARGYARAAASDNTLKAYEPDWGYFARWCRMKGTDPLPPLPEMIGLYLADLASGMTRPLPSLSRLLTVGSRNLLGITHYGGLHLTARTATSSPFWPEPSANTHGRRSRRKRFWPRTSSRWSLHCPSICAGSGIAQRQAYRSADQARRSCQFGGSR